MNIQDLIAYHENLSGIEHEEAVALLRQHEDDYKVSQLCRDQLNVRLLAAEAKLLEYSKHIQWLEAKLAAEKVAQEQFALRIMGQDAYDNSPCQAHPLQLAEEWLNAAAQEPEWQEWKEEALRLARLLWVGYPMAEQKRIDFQALSDHLDKIATPPANAAAQEWKEEALRLAQLLWVGYPMGEKKRSDFQALSDHLDKFAAPPAKSDAQILPPGLIEALRSQKQADMDGVECTVSREAVDTAIRLLTQPAPQAQVSEAAHNALQKIKELVAGDKRPRWHTDEATYSTRGYILDIINAVEDAAPQAPAIPADMVPLAEYQKLQALVTAQGIRLMETEDASKAVGSVQELLAPLEVGGQDRACISIYADSSLAVGDFLYAAPQLPAEPQERVLLCRFPGNRWTPAGRWTGPTEQEEAGYRSAGFEYRYATLDSEGS